MERRAPVECVQILLDAKADPNVWRRGQHPQVSLDPPLHHAVYNRCHDSVKLLLARGADPNVRRRQNLRWGKFADSETCLLWAVEDGREEIVTTLLENQADPNITDCDGRTCLATAVQSNMSVEVVNLLVSAGADRQVAAPRLVAADRRWRTLMGSGMRKTTNHDDEVMMTPAEWDDSRKYPILHQS